MNEPSFASLSSTLLARKGGAKPAMRPQNFAGPLDGAQIAASLEDLGWNDMGSHDAEDDGRVVPLPGAAAAAETTPDAVSPVRETIERIARKLEAPASRKPEGSLLNTKTKTARRAAFTLRLDPQRHLKLRLACTVHGKSAQVLVTEALDAMLAAMPDVDKLAAQVARD